MIRANCGTVDKYKCDCVLAFWGAPVHEPDHATLAVKAALGISRAAGKINLQHQAQGTTEIGIGIGLNTGVMCVGDMGCDVRRSYIGDADNLACRIEGLCNTYGVNAVVSETTRQRVAGDVVWQELDRVCVKGRQQPIAIFSPALLAESPGTIAELEKWELMLNAYRSQNWPRAEALLTDLLRQNGEKYLYSLYAERIALRQRLPFDAEWDGITRFDSK